MKLAPNLNTASVNGRMMMNSTVKRLASSHFPRDGEGNILATPEMLVEFAQSIARECVKVMYDNAIERKVGLEIDKRPTYYAAAILEHFGVEK